MKKVTGIYIDSHRPLCDMNLETHKELRGVTRMSERDFRKRKNFLKLKNRDGYIYF